MKAFLAQHAHHHAMHAVCGVAAIAVVAAIVFGVPLLGLVAVLFCGTMMVAMVWMMVGMAVKRGHSSSQRN